MLGPKNMFSEFWLDLLIVLAIGFAFAQVEATSALVVKVCRFVWLGFHVLYSMIGLKVWGCLKELEEGEYKDEEIQRFTKLRNSFAFKAVLTMGLHLATGLPQPLLMGGVISTIIMSPLRRDFANSFVKKYVLGIIASPTPTSSSPDTTPPATKPDEGGQARDPPQAPRASLKQQQTIKPSSRVARGSSIGSSPGCRQPLLLRTQWRRGPAKPTMAIYAIRAHHNAPVHRGYHHHCHQSTAGMTRRLVLRP